MNAVEGRPSPTLNPSFTLEFCALSLYSNSLVQIRPTQPRFLLRTEVLRLYFIGIFIPADGWEGGFPSIGPLAMAFH
jgi:hypothetical protein